MTNNKIIDICYYGLCAVALGVSFVLSVLQKSKQKNISKLKALYECIPNAVINAEKLFGNGNGQNKKLYVMTELINIALQSKTKYNYAELDKQVENVVKATKNVNVNKIENIEDTFQKQFDTTKSTDAPIDKNFNEISKNDGAVVVEIEKIKEKK